MSNSIDTRAPFFPNSKTAQKEAARLRKAGNVHRNTYDRAEEIRTKTAKDAKVSIPESIKDFSKIKKAVDASEPVDNQAKIADLKARIQAGTYEMDYDALADKVLQTES